MAERFTLYTCHACGGPAFGVFCSYACWRVDRGLPTDEKPADFGDATREAHQAAPKIYATPRHHRGHQVAAVDQVEAVDQVAPVCVACGDTGRNSKGGDCVPCVRAGRVAADPIAPAELPTPGNQAAAELPATEPDERNNRFPFSVSQIDTRRPADAGQLSLF